MARYAADIVEIHVRFCLTAFCHSHALKKIKKYHINLWHFHEKHCVRLHERSYEIDFNSLLILVSHINNNYYQWKQEFSPGIYLIILIYKTNISKIDSNTVPLRQNHWSYLVRPWSDCREFTKFFNNNYWNLYYNIYLYKKKIYK